MEAAARASIARVWAKADPGAAALGLQMAVAGVAAFFFAQLLRLEFPSWSVFTVIMLLLAQYVGAIREKAVFRMAGTIVGGVLGYLATGAWQQSPALYLAATFAITSFSVAMFSQSRAPYAFFLTGLTFVIIASGSQSQPDHAWNYALARVEEVFVGVVVSLVVQSTVFPRYANADFLKLVRATLGELAGACPHAAGRFARPDAGLGAALRDFPTRAFSLRSLLRFGARESGGFRRDLGRHSETVAQLVRAADVLRSLEGAGPAAEPYRSELGAGVRGAWDRLRDGWNLLRDGGTLTVEWKEGVAAGVSSLGDRLLELRSDPRALALPPGLVGTTSIHLLALAEIRETLVALDDLRRRPPSRTPRAESLALAPAWPDAFWIRHGIRAGLATTLALFLENWLSPPGGPLMVLAVMMFTALNALSPEGAGDRGAFSWVVGLTGVLAGAFLLLVAGTPLLASYAVMNTFLAASLFLLGYWLHDRGGITVPLQFSFLLIVSIVGLDAQHPVSVQQIAAVFFGLANALLISAVAQRLVWPVLPQRRLRDGLDDYLRTVASRLPDALETLPVWRRVRIGLFPSQARHFLRAMRGPAIRTEDLDALDDWVLTLRSLVGELFLCAGRLLPLLPPSLHTVAEPAVNRIKDLMRSGLSDLATAFTAAGVPPDRRAEIDETLSAWNECSETLRRKVHAAGLAPATGVRILGLCGRYRAALELLRSAFDQALRLRLSSCLDDVSL